VLSLHLFALQQFIGQGGLRIGEDGKHEHGSVGKLAQVDYAENNSAFSLLAGL
jgi:hypothetical protein